MKFLLVAALVFGKSWDEATELATKSVEKLSIEEKVKLVSGVGWMKGACVGNTEEINVPGFKGLCMQDSPTGIRFAHNVSSFPASINVAATFDRSLMLTRGELMGKEFRGKGINVALSPMMNLMRTPNGGRNWEGQGSDPYLTAQSVRLQVRGIQEQGVIATAKHFIGNEQEFLRRSSSSEIDDRTLHEVYLKPFRDCVDEGVGAVMCSYNLLNDTYACENDYAINHILKGQLGFKGFVMTDWWATNKTVQAANGGSDMMMPGDYNETIRETVWSEKLEKAVISDAVTQDRLDDMAIRILKSWYKLDQDIDFPSVNFDSFKPENSKEVNVQDNHHEHIRDVGAASTILLKNDGNALPLGPSLGAIAVLGSDAGPGNSSVDILKSCPDHGCSSGTIPVGWGSGTTIFPYIVTPLEGISKRSEKDGLQVFSHLDDYDIAGATRAAKQANASIIFVSSNSGEEYIVVDGNKGDRNNLTLWNNGDALITAVAEVCNKVIVVIHGPGAVNMPWLDLPSVVAVVHALYPGQESGNAIADVLFGDVNPSGRLPFTINHDMADYSANIVFLSDEEVAKGPYYPKIIYSEGLLVDYKWNDAKNIAPLFEFGFGLSYTSFGYSDFELEQVTAPAEERLVIITFKVQNTGSVDGHEVAQLYLGFPPSVGEPPKQLKDFDRQMIKSGETEEFVMQIIAAEMEIWDVEKQEYVVPAGQYTVYIGSSSRDIKWTGEYTV